MGGILFIDSAFGPLQLIFATPVKKEDGDDQADAGKQQSTAETLRAEVSEMVTLLESLDKSSTLTSDQFKADEALFLDEHRVTRRFLRHVLLNPKRPRCRVRTMDDAPQAMTISCVAFRLIFWPSIWMSLVPILVDDDPTIWMSVADLSRIWTSLTPPWMAARTRALSVLSGVMK